MIKNAVIVYRALSAGFTFEYLNYKWIMSDDGDVCVVAQASKNGQPLGERFLSGHMDMRDFWRFCEGIPEEIIVSAAAFCAMNTRNAQ